MMFGREPDAATIAWFEENRQKSGVTLGAMWLEGEPLRRVLKRVEPHIEPLKEIKAAQKANNIEK